MRKYETYLAPLRRLCILSAAGILSLAVSGCQSNEAVRETPAAIENAAASGDQTRIVCSQASVTIEGDGALEED